MRELLDRLLAVERVLTLLVELAFATTIHGSAARLECESRR